jgi:transposase
MANRALDAVFNRSRRDREVISGRDWRRARAALRTGAERLSQSQRALVDELYRVRYDLGYAWELKERLRDLYRDVDPVDAEPYLRHWCDLATHSGIASFVNLARQVRKNLDGIVAAVHWSLSNSRLEGINARIRLIQRRGYGYHSVDSLAAVIHLCLGGIVVALPTRP